MDELKMYQLWKDADTQKYHIAYKDPGSANWQFAPVYGGSPYLDAQTHIRHMVFLADAGQWPSRNTQWGLSIERYLAEDAT